MLFEIDVRLESDSCIFLCTFLLSCWQSGIVENIKTLVSEYRTVRNLKVRPYGLGMSTSNLVSLSTHNSESVFGQLLITCILTFVLEWELYFYHFLLWVSSDPSLSSLSLSLSLFSLSASLSLGYLFLCSLFLAVARGCAWAAGCWQVICGRETLSSLQDPPHQDANCYRGKPGTTG